MDRRTGVNKKGRPLYPPFYQLPHEVTLDQAFFVSNSTN